MNNLIRPAFTTTRLEEERAADKGKVFTVRFNDRDLELLAEIRESWGLDSDNATIRAAVFFSHNVSHTLFANGLDNLLFKKKRLKEGN